MTRSPVDRIADELALRRLVDLYVDATCRADPPGIADTFIADGHWSAAGVAEARGREELEKTFSGLLTAFSLLIQGVSSGLVQLDPADPDRATGRWYIWEVARMADGTDFRAAGVYHDQYVRQQGEWRFASRRFNSMFIRRGEEVTTSPFPADAPEL